MSKMHPEILYHYTCEFHLGSIMRSKLLDLTYSNVNNTAVLWMSSNPDPNDLGVGTGGNTLPEFDKTRYRFSIRWQPHFKKWTKWCKEQGIDQESMDLLIQSSGRTDTHESWYVSEIPVPIECWVSIDNIASGRHLWDPSIA